MSLLELPSGLLARIVQHLGPGGTIAHPLDLHLTEKIGQNSTIENLLATSKTSLKRVLSSSLEDISLGSNIIAYLVSFYSLCYRRLYSVYIFCGPGSMGLGHFTVRCYPPRTCR